MSISIIRTLSVILLLAALPPVHAGIITFDFNSAPPGTATAFTDTVGGLSATFSSSGDPGGFAVSPTFFATLTGNVLLDPGPAAQDNLGLTIDFSAPLSFISMLFATNSGPGVPLFLDAFSGGNLVASTSAIGTIPAGFSFPEGLISLGGTIFDRVVISSPATDFAIDDVSASVSPEPSTILLGIGGLGLIGFAKRFRK